MALDRKLNFIVPVETDKGEALVRSAPLSSSFFRQNFLVISKTFARLHGEGLGITTAPRVAAMMLERVERDLIGVSPDDPAPPSPVMNEIRRLTNVELPDHGLVPWAQVVSSKMFSEEDVEEVENAIVFFIVASSMYHRRDVEEMIGGAARLWNARLESSSITVSPTSSPTSKETASSGATAPPSAIPR